MVWFNAIVLVLRALLLGGASIAAAKGNKGASDDKDPMPKQSDYGSLGEFGEAMRSWRARRSSASEKAAQKAALTD